MNSGYYQLISIYFFNYEKSENTILITGAASGIGLEIARLFSQHNNKVIMVNRSGGELYQASIQF